MVLGCDEDKKGYKGGICCKEGVVTEGDVVGVMERGIVAPRE